MGATESCCGKREWTVEMPSAPQNPISGLRHQYVTFESGQAEAFLLPVGVWRQNSSYEVHDVEGSCWFRIDGRNAASSRCKKLILNTGIHHSTMERAGNVWHVHVGGEKRVSVEKDTATQQVYARARVCMCTYTHIIWLADSWLCSILSSSTVIRTRPQMQKSTWTA
jgi:hypothetical protein